jgi:hypothetical protein
MWWDVAMAIPLPRRGGGMGLPLVGGGRMLAVHAAPAEFLTGSVP